jgi:hypothetical protein
MFRLKFKVKKDVIGLDYDCGYFCTTFKFLPRRYI